ncbi:hypothetical protein C1S82_02165 [Mycolicibacterium cosmeticum]|uniref:Hypothetical proline rich protein n=1 Tax=Mycolicibacterium cosmeticum TaxID=258533 RepID=W9AXS2_MYCCO|nr:hypothetical protein [Mycolicibacterium cosmeticum]TLH81531.1 hypothetical protein C1S82_02165 [Mycolicibacterium cosmeticum]CDO10338.1 hypothetical proline rich protein [Mycolicibacterium cosmeticum]
MKFQLRREGENRHWPHYLLWGRMRTSTFALIVAFFFTWWLYNTYAPAPAPPPAPAQQVVPPGFVPDPEYTWVPRTKVETPRSTYRTTTTTTTPTTEPTTTTETTPPTDTTTPGVPPTTTTTPAPPTTTVIDPDGPGPIPPLTLPVLPGAVPPPTTQTTIDPGVAPATPPPPARSAS